MIQRLLFVFLLLAAAACSADPLVLSVGGLVEGRASTSRLTSLKVEATNVSSEEPLVFLWITVEKKRSDGQFAGFRTDILCPCDHKCDREPFRLKKGQSVRGTWDFKSSDCELARSGIYRFAVIARYSDASTGYVYHGASKEFTVVE